MSFISIVYQYDVSQFVVFFVRDEVALVRFKQIPQLKLKYTNTILILFPLGKITIFLAWYWANFTLFILEA